MPSTAHFLQENIGPGTYRTLLHQEHSCGCMMGSSVAIRNSRPGGRPHCKHLAGASPLRNQVRSVRKSAAITDPSLLAKSISPAKTGTFLGLTGSAQLGDEFGVGRRELIIADVIWVYPSQIRDIDRPGITLQNGTIKKVEPDGLCRVVVIDGEKLVVNPDFYSEFLLDFPLQRHFKGLSEFDFSTRK